MTKRLNKLMKDNISITNRLYINITNDWFFFYKNLCFQSYFVLLNREYISLLHYPLSHLTSKSRNWSFCIICLIQLLVLNVHYMTMIGISLTTLIHSHTMVSYI